MSRLPEPPLVANPSPSARRWNKLRPVPDSHRQESQRLILEVAGQVNPGAAIVLGAGRCDEVPLVALADRFEQVTLNDQDRSLLDEAVAAHHLANHDPPLAFEAADLTGVTQRLLDQAGRRVATVDSPETAIEQLTELVSEVKPVPYSPRETFDLVVASCVLSQLHVRAVEQLVGLMAERWPGSDQGTSSIQALRSSKGFTSAMLGLAHKMEEEFVTSIYHLLAPGGIAYVSDTVQFCFIHGQADGSWASDGSYRMTRTVQLSDYFDDRFRLARLGQWPWVYQPPQGAGQVGRLYNVQALAVSNS